MTDHDVGQYWDRNADTWTALARAGYDIYRTALNTPAFLEMVPNVRGLRGVDIGCGEGGNTRAVAQRGAHMIGIDIARRFVVHATDAEARDPLGIAYYVASAQLLPFANDSFDFATSFMCLMDVPDPAMALAEAHRVIRSGGFLQFSIMHPCFDTPHRRNLRDEHRQTYAIEVGGYFNRIDGRIDTWLFTAAPQAERAKHRPFQVPRFHRTISEWFNMIVGAGFHIERVAEPRASEELAHRVPEVQDTRVVAYFLHVRCRKA